MALPTHKTKIVCTIGPACDNQETLQAMIRAGMNVARLNFSHGDFSMHAGSIERIRTAARAVELRVAVMADLPGPKMRIGKLAEEPIELRNGDPFSLCTEEIAGDSKRVSVSYTRLHEVVKRGDTLFLNDGLIQLEVLQVNGSEVECRVVVGGELRSRKGLNLPGIDLGLSAFTDHDRDCLRFALEHGVDAVSQSFVENAADLQAVRSAARALGYSPFIIAKIERSRALSNLDAILDAADGVMIARGDLGVEVPIEQIAVVQKQLTRKANLLGKPVITATQMLESMVDHRRPTRAEATDVANAILDGTDCVMLSEESAMGQYPVDAVAMLAKIATAIEPCRANYALGKLPCQVEGDAAPALHDVIASSVVAAVAQVNPAAVFVPTHGGVTARSITRFRLPVWIAAVSSQEATCQQLAFSYGVHAICESEHPEAWKSYVQNWMQTHGMQGDIVILTEGPSTKNPDGNNRMEIIDLSRP
jgi:pyruvate kinase